MKKYHLLLKGENFLIDFVDKENKCGFYTNIWLQANNPEEAELKAVEIVRSQENLKESTLNDPNDPPMIYLEEIHELKDDAELKENTGRAFFLEENQ